MRAFEVNQDERAAAIRTLLARPLVRRQSDADAFRAIAVHRADLAKWFEENLGWRLQVDLPGGVARLHKRSSAQDPHRGIRRQSGTQRPFDPLRYQLLALVCAHLLRRSHVTLGDLADALGRVSGSDPDLREFDPTRHAHRLAFVDVLVWLREMGAVETTVGDLEGFASAERKNAVLRADTTVIPLLLSTDTPPSRVRADADTDMNAWVTELTREPRYGTAPTAPEEADRDQRIQWARHQALRRLLDDPVVDMGTLPPVVREYLQSPAGREKAIREVGAAGLECERHVDVWLAVDPTGESSDLAPLFGSRSSIAQQTAGVVLAALSEVGDDGERRMMPRTVSALEAALEAQLKRHRKWAQGARKAGVGAMCAEAVELLQAFGLVECVGDEVCPRPAAARYSVAVDSADRPTERTT
jgi:uncharacterized protein (TIGR02678 family)